MFSVPVIASNLRHEETIIQAVNALEYLQNLIDDVFNKINNRIDKNKKKLVEVQLRIDKVNNIITNLEATNKAIKIFSPSKFPAAYVFRDIPMTFFEYKKNESDRIFESDYIIESNQEPINIQEKLVFFHIQDRKSKSSRLAKIQNDGFRTMPNDLKSVNSVLLFNTFQNAYQTPENRDTYKLRSPQKINAKQEAGHQIEAAPLSITNRQHSCKKMNQKLFYTPKLSDAPEINLPIDLPDLPGIADDIQFEFKEKEKIAPSLFIEDLPDLPTPIEIDIPTPIEVNVPLPPPKSSNLLIAEVKVVPPPTNPAPPPPPPPPPPQIQSLPSPITNTLNKASLPDARANLMEEIRKAGGARGGELKVAPAFPKSNKDLKFNSEKPAGNLMDDLHNKLLMRRKGISGAKAQEFSDNTVINRLSELIPPPLKLQNKLSTSESEDEDWK